MALFFCRTHSPHLGRYHKRLRSAQGRSQLRNANPDQLPRSIVLRFSQREDPSRSLIQTVVPHPMFIEQTRSSCEKPQVLKLRWSTHLSDAKARPVAGAGPDRFSQLAGCLRQGRLQVDRVTRRPMGQLPAGHTIGPVAYPGRKGHGHAEGNGRVAASRTEPCRPTVSPAWGPGSA